jgi:hypothetical protein
MFAVDLFQRSSATPQRALEVHIALRAVVKNWSPFCNGSRGLPFLVTPMVIGEH